MFNETPPPLGWTQPTLPPLPPGEAQRDWPLEVWGTTATFPPPAAPGFQAAWRMGILPSPPPEQPPTPVPGLTSWDRLRLTLLLAFGVFGLVIWLGNRFDAGAWIVVPLTATFGASVWVFVSTDARDQVERAAGYTSTQNYTGLWRIAKDGRVLREPDRNVAPPGWYPSPYYPGLLQLWEGPGWKPLPQKWHRHADRYFRRPEVPFL